jgi:hypothetical protein
MAVVAVLTALTASHVETQPFQRVVGWYVTVLHAHSTGNTHRLYDAPRELGVSLAMSNDSGAELEVDYQRLQERVRVSVIGDREIPVIAAWPLGAGSARAWTITLTRKDGQPFAVGRYKIDVSIAAAYEVMRAPGGKRLRGVEHQSVGAFVVIQPPANARERAAAYRLLGKRKVVEDPAEGLRLFVLAAEADPTDRGALVDLGRAYVQTRRCRDAIRVFERALRPLDGHSVVPDALAHAYVCVGDEKRAAQVLRESGRSEERITDSLERFRKTVPR